MDSPETTEDVPGLSIKVYVEIVDHLGQRHDLCRSGDIHGLTLDQPLDSHTLSIQPPGWPASGVAFGV